MTLISPKLRRAHGSVYRKVSLVRSEAEFAVMEKQDRHGMRRNRSTLGKASAQAKRHDHSTGRRLGI